MPQDQAKKAAHENADHAEKEARAAAIAERELDDQILHTDNHTGQQGATEPAEDTRDPSQRKDIIALLPNFHKDELRRLTIVPVGTPLRPSTAYIDLRDLRRGELTATGDETVDEHILLVAKHDVDPEIWTKLLGQ